MIPQKHLKSQYFQWFSDFVPIITQAKLVLLRNLPKLVSRTLSGNSSPFSSLSSVIVLNLYIVKIFSLSPGLCCLKITGLPNLILTSKAITMNIGLRTIIAIKDRRKSRGLLKYLLYTLDHL
jgi:hypothetical protein